MATYQSPTLQSLPERLGSPDNAREFLRLCVRQIGVGYHPDTDPADYEPAFDALTAERLEALHVEAFDLLGEEVYAVALAEQQELLRGDPMTQEEADARQAEEREWHDGDGEPCGLDF